jgi:PAS domain S-box-containing protein
MPQTHASFARANPYRELYALSPLTEAGSPGWQHMAQELHSFGVTELGACHLMQETTKKHILVVGEASAVQDIRRTLPDYRVRAVRPEELEASNRFEHPDLVIVDVRSEGGTHGIEAALRLRSQSDPPVVILTASAASLHVPQVGETQPYGYLLKPFTDRDLRHAVDTALQRRGFEHTLAVRELWLETTLRNVGDAIVATDADGRILLMNPAAESLTGWKQSEALGRASHDVLQMLSADDGKPIEDAVVRVRRAGCVVTLDRATLLRNRSGAEIPIDDSVAPIMDGSRLQGVVIVLRDISTRRSLEARLALAERLAGLGMLAAGAAHEINNPLAYSLANCEVAQRELAAVRDGLHGARPVDDRLEQHLAALEHALHDAREGAERVQRVVNDLKMVSKPPAARPASTFALVPVLESATRMAWNEIKHRARFVRDFRAAPFARGNDTQIAQVLMNLLINAAQAIPEGHEHEHEIRLVLDVDAVGDSVIEVCDTGPGIPPEVMVHIFDPFFSTKPSGIGTGLGLSISHGLIEANAGTLSAESVLGKGSMFRVWLPRAEPALATAEIASTNSAVPAARRAQILVVDDEPSITSVIGRAFGATHDVSVAARADEALALLHSGRRFDLILCDLLMPGMSGAELHERLSSELPGQAERMVFLSGGAFTPRARDFLESIDTRRKLEKPFLLAAVEKLIHESIAGTPS